MFLESRGIEKLKAAINLRAHS